ncbi:hypothetical protein K431DRAFT_298554 [Polychaeton citri CBS 116435]|uniref:Uncharacterized protein n=1 Tax=Polychaeton citri CBS 116435 TaxID=1314669 RepID=A0A9P4Q1Y7_9PEZI|nr:hypothetical protein K431DRAFT_298554 [Polychaeton citri CBS 116435]
MACQWGRLPIEVQQRICILLLPRVELVESPQDFQGKTFAFKVINPDEVMGYLNIRQASKGFKSLIADVWDHHSVATLAMDMEVHARPDTPATPWFAESKMVPTLPFTLFSKVRHLHLTQTYVVRSSIRDHHRVLLCRCNKWHCRGFMAQVGDMIIISEPFPYFSSHSGSGNETFTTRQEAENVILHRIVDQCGVAESFKTDPSLLQEISADDPRCTERQTRAQHVIRRAFNYRLVNMTQAIIKFTRRINGLGLECTFGPIWDGNISLDFEMISEDELLAPEMQAIRSHVRDRFQLCNGSQALGSLETTRPNEWSSRVFLRLWDALHLCNFELPRQQKFPHTELIIQRGISWRRFMAGKS